MSGPEHPPLELGAGSLSGARTARGWAAGVLAAATLVLAGYLALVLVAAWLLVSAVDAVRDVETAPLDLTSLLLDVAPGLLAGWCVGLLGASVLVRGQALGARSAGCVAGGLGALVGAAVLALTDVL